MYSVRNIVINYITSVVWWHIVTRLIVKISLKCTEILNNYAVQQELT